MLVYYILYTCDARKLRYIKKKAVQLHLYYSVNLDDRSALVVNARRRPTYPRERDLVPILQEAGWAPGLDWTDAGNLAPPEFHPRTIQPVTWSYNYFIVFHFFFIRRRMLIFCTHIFRQYSVSILHYRSIRSLVITLHIEPLICITSCCMEKVALSWKY